MARENGQLRTCDRCGKTIFLKTIGDGETDGGYTRWNKFEEAKGWSNERDIGDLCPDCTDLFNALKQTFAKEVKKFKNKE